MTCFGLGIGLFTFHKYRKTIESTIPLDAHGNPVEDIATDNTRAHVYHGVAEAWPLTSGGSRVNDDVRYLIFFFLYFWGWKCRKVDCFVHLYNSRTTD